MTEINWEIVSSNLEEAKEELDRMVLAITADGGPDEAELRIAFQHLYHHINFAWNARNVSVERYSAMTDSDFKTWGAYPLNI